MNSSTAVPKPTLTDMSVTRNPRSPWSFSSCLFYGRPRQVDVPEKTTRDDLLTRDTLLLLLLFRKRGFQGSISRLAVDELGYADDSAVNRRIHELEDRGLVAERKDKLGYVLTSTGRSRILPLTFPRRLTLIILLMSMGIIIWGLDGTLLNTPVLPLWILGSGVAFAVMSLLVVYVQVKMEDALLGTKRNRSSPPAGAGQASSGPSSQGPAKVAD